MSFVYTPLSSPRSIRVVRLKPALTKLKPITCSLHEVALDDCQGQKPSHPYEALSYTWGASTGTETICCDGKPLLVTPNCKSALLHLRHKFEVRVLWIDAICIDQQSIDEKNCQVPLMGEIYSSAARVMIWLGLGSGDEENALLRAHVVGRAYHARVPTGMFIERSRTVRVASKLITTKEVEKMRLIRNNPWFRRMWTLQEVLLAKKAEVQIGNTKCPASDLYSYQSIIDAGQSDLASPDESLFHMRIRALEMIDPERIDQNQYLYYFQVELPSETQDEKLEKYLSLIVKIAALTDATDLRDKGYAMMALVSKMVPTYIPPRVDYKRSVEQVLKDFTWSLMRSTMTLWPLELIARPETGPSAHLPSWVLDLRAAEHISKQWKPRVRREALYHTEMELPETNDSNRLPVRARFLAEVIEVYTTMPEFTESDSNSDEDDTRRAIGFSEWAAVTAQMDDFSGLNRDSEASWTKFLFELTPRLGELRERYGYEKKNQGEDGSTTTEPDMFNFNPTWEDAKDEFFRAQAASVYDGATLFLTSCDTGVDLCLSKGIVQVGDKLCQLAGGRYPFLLREVATAEQDKPGEYCLKGVADVYKPDPSSQVAWKWEWEDLKQEQMDDIYIV